jgi:glycosyltransferase involved in cell wall biosynthesis
MRILFLSGWFPYPPDNGARIRVLNLLKHLSRRHEITLLAFTQDEETQPKLEQVRAYCREVQTVPQRPFRPHRLRALMGFFLPHPRALTDTYSLPMQTLVQRTLAQNRFDIVVASEIGIGLGTAPYIRKVDSIPRILEDLELSMIKGRMAAERGWGQRLRHSLTWWKLRRFAARLLRDLDGCTVASEKEQDLVLGIVPGYRSLAVVPNGIDLDFRADNFGTPESGSLIFPGALTYRANFDAMDFFLRQVFPSVKAKCSGVTLRITGRTDGVPVDRLPLDESVILTGYLDDVRPAVAQSWACVVPLRVGGGTRLKILEAMALGTPVVSTTKGAEGLEVIPGEDILIADGPIEFADAILHLLGDRALRAKLAVNGRRLVEERYSWKTSAQKLERLLCQVVEQKNYFRERALDD